MEIATGYFARAKDYADIGYALVSIALKAPRFLPTNLNLSYFPISDTRNSQGTRQTRRLHLYVRNRCSVQTTTC